MKWRHFIGPENRTVLWLDPIFTHSILAWRLDWTISDTPLSYNCLALATHVIMFCFTMGFERRHSKIYAAVTQWQSRCIKSSGQYKGPHTKNWSFFKSIFDVTNWKSLFQLSQNFLNFWNILFFKEVMAIYVPPKSPNIWRPILGPARASK